ncbi:hypothetical protein HMPREF6745_0502 [Prevotella sp. oral taxon 472 str. F0295]|nr:hypothetical protein HMPREF6745_0502 [Prevotella sp. oral taxon 472 str. F0295]
MQKKGWNVRWCGYVGYKILKTVKPLACIFRYAVWLFIAASSSSSRLLSDKTRQVFMPCAIRL